MLHKFLEPGDWFAAKTFGFGAGRPVAWQGWVVLAAYAAVMAGSTLLIATGTAANRGVGILFMLLATSLLIWIARARTRGGWHWRWGNGD